AGGRAVRRALWRAGQARAEPRPDPVPVGSSTPSPSFSTRNPIPSWPGLSRPSTKILPVLTVPQHIRMMLEAWIYMMTNRPNGILYLGVTADLIRRVWQHREGLVEGFTKRYGLTRLVYVERHPDIGSPLHRPRPPNHLPRT